MIPTSLPAEGLRVPLRAAFAGMKGIDWLAAGHNNLNPLLVLYDTEVEFRVFRKQRRLYSEIEYVDFRRGAGTNLLILAWRDSGRTFAGNISYLDELPPTEALRRVLQFFESKQVPFGAEGRHWLHGTATDEATGTPVVSAPVVAGVSSRLLSNLVDLVILSIASSALALLLFASLSSLSIVNGDRDLMGILVWICFPLLCVIFEASRLMGTPGKRFVGLVVLDARGKRIGYARALLRCLLKWATLPLTLPQALLYRSLHPGPLWHDTLSGTCVVEQWSMMGSDHVPSRDLHRSVE